MSKTEWKADAEIEHLRGLHKQLGSIELSLRHRRAGLLGPRGYCALLAAVAVFASGYAATFAVARVGGIIPRGFLWIVFAVAVLIMWLLNRYSSAPRTYTEKITALLRRYDPVEVEAYLALLAGARKYGSVQSDILHDWIQREHYAVHQALQRCSAQSLAAAVIARARDK
jgi:hypothetical protein